MNKDILYTLFLVDEVLVQFREKFIKEMDANTIVRKICLQGVISQADLVMIEWTVGRREQNQFLHQRLMNTCTKDNLMTIIVEAPCYGLQRIDELIVSKS